MPPAVFAVDLARRFGATDAVAGVDLRIEAGEIYGFLGPNGAGKSTTVRMLTTLLRPSAGRAEVAGFDIARQPDEVRLRIGVALQDASIDPKQSGRELLDLQGRFYGLDAPTRRRRADELIGLVDLGEAIDRRVATYSGGMRRRLDLALALVHEPEVLFLDEPTTGLDPASRALVWSEVRRLNTEVGMTIFLTTQYLEEADELADRVGIIAGGRLVAEGPPADLKRAVGTDLIVVHVHDGADRVAGVLAAVPGVGAVELRAGEGRVGEVRVSVADGASTVSPVVVALAQAGIRVDGLELRSPTLDDVFLTLTGAHLQEER